MPRSKGMFIGFWIATVLFCLQMSFTACAQLLLPEVADAFTHLGMGLRRLRHQPRLRAHRPSLRGRWPGGMGFCGGHQCALGPLVLVLAPHAVHVDGEGASCVSVGGRGRARPSLEGAMEGARAGEAQLVGRLLNRELTVS